MKQSMPRSPRESRPVLEGLEERQLLAASASASATDPSSLLPGKARILDVQNGVSAQDRRIAYVTPQGTHVIVTLYGLGSLAGSTVDADGALNLVFSGTGSGTGIVGKVAGGTGQAPLRSILPKGLAPSDLSGIGSTVLNVVNLKNFNLVDNGQINITGGIHSLYLNSVGHNTQVHLRQLPADLPTTSASGTESINGVTLGYNVDAIGVTTLTSVSGQFTAPASPYYTSTPPEPDNNGSGFNPGPPIPPPGVTAVINHVKGAPSGSLNGLPDAEIFGLDATTNTLIRFDAVTGAQLQRIPLTGMASATAGIALARDDGRQVVLVGDGTTISAFDASTGSPVGQFTTTNLAALGLTTIDGIGTSDLHTMVSDSTAGGGGRALLIDVTASLNSGQAVPIGQPFTPQRQFLLSGGLSGIPASNTVFGTGAAHFDTFQPNNVQYGILAMNTSGGRIRETSRTPLTSGGQELNVIPPPKHQSLGSVDQALALDTGVTNGQNTVALLNPTNLASVGAITLDDPNPLVDLSESFRPQLANSALIDIQGNVQSFRAKDARGMVLNVAGPINLAKIDRSSNSLIIGEPFGHAQMPHRSNVTILSTSRPVDNRNGVKVDPSLKQVGPLSLPS
jgi:hypothetical protein